MRFDKKEIILGGGIEITKNINDISLRVCMWENGIFDKISGLESQYVYDENGHYIGHDDCFDVSYYPTYNIKSAEFYIQTEITFYANRSVIKNKFPDIADALMQGNHNLILTTEEKDIIYEVFTDYMVRNCRDIYNCNTFRELTNAINKEFEKGENIMQNSRLEKEIQELKDYRKSYDPARFLSGKHFDENGMINQKEFLVADIILLLNELKPYEVQADDSQIKAFLEQKDEKLCDGDKSCIEMSSTEDYTCNNIRITLNEQEDKCTALISLSANYGVEGITDAYIMCEFESEEEFYDLYYLTQDICFNHNGTNYYATASVLNNSSISLYDYDKDEYIGEFDGYPAIEEVQEFIDKELSKEDAER